MCDEFSARYGDLLTGSYDCVDRVVLNAYFFLAHSPGGFRTWWRRWHSDSDEDLERMIRYYLTALGKQRVMDQSEFFRGENVRSEI